jgi:hypothetical protein
MTEDPTPLTPHVRHGLHPELRDVAARLHAEFDADLTEATVDAALDEVAARFAEARVRSFVPLLVHRYARTRLGTGAATAVPRRDAEPARSDAAAVEASAP